MKRTISAVEARQHFGEVLEGVFYRGDEVIIERAGRSMGVVIPIERYEAMERDREDLFDLIETIQQGTAGVPQEVIERAVAQALREVRTRKRKPSARRAG